MLLWARIAILVSILLGFVSAVTYKSVAGRVGVLLYMALVDLPIVLVLFAVT